LQFSKKYVKIEKKFIKNKNKSMVFQENYSPQPKTQDSNILLQEQPKVLCESDFKSEVLTISLLEKAGQKEKAQELRTALNEAFTRMQENKAAVKLN